MRANIFNMFLHILYTEILKMYKITFPEEKHFNVDAK